MARNAHTRLQKLSANRLKTVALALCLCAVSYTGVATAKVPNLAPRKPDAHILYPDRFLPPASLVTQADARAAKLVFKALDKNRFKDALRLTRKVKNPSVVKVLVWSYLTARRSPAKFNDIRSFLDNQQDWGQVWPQRVTMLRRAEETMSAKLQPQDVQAWFKTMGGPVSTAGRMREAEALLALGNTDQGVKAVRRLWIDGNFGKAQEKRFYRRHKKHITKADNTARLERLVWAEKFWPARRQIWKVNEATRKLAVARLWLMRREGNVDKAIKDLQKTAPNLLDHAGLVYERARWRRRKNKTDGAVELIKDFHGDPVRADKWWVERAILARTFLQKDKPAEAYELTSRHGLKAKYGAKFADAEWLSGWIQLRFLNNPERALQHFTHMLKSVNFPISLARGAYWAGRAAKAMGHADEAQKWMAQAATYPTTYYGQLAARSLGHDPAPFPNGDHGGHGPDAKTLAAFKANPIRRAAQILAEIGEPQRMRPFIIHLADAHESGAWQQLTARFATRYGRPDLAIHVAKASERGGWALGQVSYPALQPPSHKAISDPVETPLVLAVIRQESAFYVNSKSHAGARGLMQVMPATAKRVARDNRLPYDRERLMKDANYNLVIGQVYLSDMVGKFDGSYAMALAAYNAGPHRVKRWVRTFGDPRSDAVDMVDWIEMIPYSETRNYVQRVLENLSVYRVKLNGEQASLPLR